MPYRYRFHCRGLALVVMFVCAMALALPVGWNRGWIPGVAISGAALALAALVFFSECRRARRLGRLVVDEDGVRRVRGDGRVVERMRWAQLRAVIYDDRRKLLLFQGKDASGLCCSGPFLVGGVGLERFARFVDEIGRHTDLPVTAAPGCASARRRPAPSRAAPRSIDQTTAGTA